MELFCFVLGWNKWQFGKQEVDVYTKSQLCSQKVTGKGSRVTSQGMFII